MDSNQNKVKCPECGHTDRGAGCVQWWGSLAKYFCRYAPEFRTEPLYDETAPIVAPGVDTREWWMRKEARERSAIRRK